MEVLIVLFINGGNHVRICKVSDPECHPPEDAPSVPSISNATSLSSVPPFHTCVSEYLSSHISFCCFIMLPFIYIQHRLLFVSISHPYVAKPVVPVIQSTSPSRYLGSVFIFFCSVLYPQSMSLSSAIPFVPLFLSLLTYDLMCFSLFSPSFSPLLLQTFSWYPSANVCSCRHI
jgi:hypothetical protein